MGLLNQLLLESDQLRKEQMLLKFCLQLRTYPCDNAVQMQKPFNVANAVKHQRALEACGVCVCFRLAVSL